MHQTVLNIYKQHGILRNEDLYKLASKKLNNKNSYDFKHNIRAAQEYLQKKGLLYHYQYKTWGI